MTFRQIEADLQTFLGRRPRASMRDIAKMIDCHKAGDYTPMFSTDLYTKHGGEYCRLLEFLYQKRLDKIFRGMSIDLWHGHNFAPGRFYADSFFHPHGSLSGHAYNGNIFLDEAGLIIIGDYSTNDSALIAEAFNLNLEEAVS